MIDTVSPSTSLCCFNFLTGPLMEWLITISGKRCDRILSTWYGVRPSPKSYWRHRRHGNTPSEFKSSRQKTSFSFIVCTIPNWTICLLLKLVKTTPYPHGKESRPAYGCSAGLTSDRSDSRRFLIASAYCRAWSNGFFTCVSPFAVWIVQNLGLHLRIVSAFHSFTSITTSPRLRSITTKSGFRSSGPIGGSYQTMPLSELPNS